MNKQKSKDYKIMAIRLYKKLKSIRKVCDLIGCSKTTLQRWIIRFYEFGDLERKEYSTRKSKVTDEMKKYINKELGVNPSLTLGKIKKKELILSFLKINLI